MRPEMSTEQNKAVVRRWMTEVLQGGDLETIDEVLAPNYVNPAMGDTDRAGMRALLTQLRAAGTWHFSEIDLVAEGDAVVARFILMITQTGGEKLTAHGLTYYRLVDGRIVEDDPFARPDLAQLLGVAPLAP
jgi:predicted SnoaL-like aldol condensation-catalyzing enzyme